MKIIDICGFAWLIERAFRLAASRRHRFAGSFPHASPRFGGSGMTGTKAPLKIVPTHRTTSSGKTTGALPTDTPVSPKPKLLDLKTNCRRLKKIHEKDLAEGWGRVQLPDALYHMDPYNHCSVTNEKHTNYQFKGPAPPDNANMENLNRSLQLFCMVAVLYKDQDAAFVKRTCRITH